ncbi:MAG TPA: tetratricopeptide repeat protein [Candidatus Sulfotelmatobacter sp.]|nr:tetratricopeptide repeat protein [Candidatus Sulfotelmatobacter sp.]
MARGIWVFIPAKTIEILLILLLSPFCFSQSPAAPTKELQHAAALLQSGDLPGSIAAYQQILAKDPNNETAMLGLAAAYRTIFNYSQSRQLLEEAAKHHPRSAAALIELGKLDIHQQHYDDAIQRLTIAVQRQPQLALAHEQLGVAYEAKGNEERALRELDRAVRLNPKAASAHYFRGDLYAQRDDYEHAYADATQAYSQEPNPQTRVLLAKSATHIGKCDQAVDLLQPMIADDSSDPKDLFLLANAYKCAGKTEEAKTIQATFESRSKQAAEAKAQKMEADHLAAQAAEVIRANQLAAALDLLNEALAKDPENSQSHGLLAKIDFSRSDISGAKDEITRALHNDPYNPDHLYVLGKILQTQQDLKGALAAFQKTVLVNPTESDAYYEIGQIQLLLGNRTLAVQAFSKSVQLSPDDPDYRKALLSAKSSKPH